MEVYMKFWTIQTSNVTEIIQKNGIYQPDFKDSRYLKQNKKLKELYYFILKSFNQINKNNLPGIVFAFAQNDGKKEYPIEDIKHFETFIRNKKDVVGYMWKSFDKDNSIIMELYYEEPFNPIYIDYNDFQFLMPPKMIVPPYTKKSFDRIHNAIQTGQLTISVFPSGIIQAHLPYIEKKNIVNTYSMFDL